MSDGAPRKAPAAVPGMAALRQEPEIPDEVPDEPAGVRAFRVIEGVAAVSAAPGMVEFLDQYLPQHDPPSAGVVVQLVRLVPVHDAAGGYLHKRMRRRAVAACSKPRLRDDLLGVGWIDGPVALTVYYQRRNERARRRGLGVGCPIAHRGQRRSRRCRCA